MFKNRWWVVFASAVALIAGQGVVMTFAAGVFVKPLTEQLHVGRGVIVSAMGLGSTLTAVMNPFTGRLLDRFGFRIVLLPLVGLFAIVTASLSLLQASVVLLFVMFAFQGLVSTGGTPTPYTKMITTRFDQQRGLALGLCLMGVGLGTALLPQYGRFLLQHYGWRGGYVGLGAAIAVLAFIPIAIWFGEPEELRKARQQSRSKETASLPGVDFSEAVRSPKYWAITFAVAFGVMAVTGSLLHVVPLLTDRGYSMAKAVNIMSTSGLALIAGRVIAGYLLDKFFACHVAVCIFACPMIGIAILALGVGGAGPVIAVALLGIGVGAEHDLEAFAISRYFGTKAFGAMHGLAFSFATLGTGVSISLLAWFFQLRHSYTLGFLVLEGLLLVSVILMARLGPYRYPAVSPREALRAEVHATGG